MEITTGMLLRTKQDWEQYAKESVSVENIKGTIYGFGSELACLRLYYRYRHSIKDGKVDVGFSKNMNSWYFSLELRF